MDVFTKESCQYESMYDSIFPDKTYQLTGAELINLFNQEMYRILDHIPASVFWKDAQGAYLGCNQYMLEMLSFSDRSQVIGKTDEDFFWQAEAHQFQKIDQQVLKENNILLFEESPTLPDGKKPTYLSIKAPLDFEKKIGIIGCSIDISKQKHAELKIEQIGALSGNIAHDIKNHLLVLSLNQERLNLALDLVLQEGLNDKIKNMLLTCQKTAQKYLEKIQNLIDQNLQQVRLEMLEEYCASETAIHSMSEAVENVRQTFLAIGLTQDSFQIESMNDFVYQGAPLWMERILTNLIDNSLRAIRQKGQGKIFIRNKKIQGNSCLEIKDTAGGLTEADLKALLEPYKTRKVLGTGFGLAAVHYYMQKMQGQVEMFLEEDCIVFRLIFPQNIPS